MWTEREWVRTRKRSQLFSQQSYSRRKAPPGEINDSLLSPSRVLFLPALWCLLQPVLHHIFFFLDVWLLYVCFSHTRLFPRTANMSQFISVFYGVTSIAGVQQCSLNIKQIMLKCSINTCWVGKNMWGISGQAWMWVLDDITESLLIF